MKAVTGHSRQQAYIAGIIGLALMLPSLFTGLQLDDYYHWGVVTQHSLIVQARDVGGVFGLFTFVDGDVERTRQLIDKGMLPWWTLPELKYAFWRPLSELTHGIDYLLWPKQPVLMHLQSLLYFVLLMVAVYKLLQRWLNDAALTWAFWIFALSFTHGFAVGWLANRNAVLASLFVALTLHFHDQWRHSSNNKNNNRFLLLGSACFLLGLLCGEMGVSGGLFLLAYATCMEQAYQNDHGSIRGHAIQWFRRLLTILPYGVIGILWLLSRKLMGYGAFGSGHYVDPANVTEFVAVMGERYSQLLTGLFWSLPPEFSTRYGSGLQITVGTVGTLLLVVVLAPMIKAMPVARFFAVSILLMLVPLCATVPHSRLLIAASIPMAGLIGLYFASRKKVARKQQETVTSPVAPVLSVMLMVSLLLVSPLAAVGESLMMRLGMDGLLNIGAKNMPIDENHLNKTQVILNPPLSSVAGYVQGVRAYHGQPVAKAVIPLSSALRPVQLTMIDSSSFTLAASDGLYQADAENLLRSASFPMTAGDTLQFADIDARVDVVNQQGVPTQVTFRLMQPLDHYVFYLWHRSNPVLCSLPPAGTTLTLTQDKDSCAL
ncbi:MAG: hypothetical protein CSA49_06440 [Gammaproteobacteria bacterium]|nr:MAG: hypothetical protein CSA49_06440 [Gammaproteobacteria bacterium]